MSKFCRSYPTPFATSILDRIRLADVLRRLGITPPANPRKLIKCPFSDHRDMTPSFRVFERGFVCFGCGRRGGLLRFVIERGLARDNASAARWLEHHCL